MPRQTSDPGAVILSALLCGVLVYASAAGSLTAQGPSPKVSIEPRVRRRATPNESTSGVIRVEVNRVLIPVTVTNPYGRLVQGLHKKDFRLFEDGVEQQPSE